MNVANILTGSRVALSPLFFVLFFLPQWTGWSSPILFIALWVVYGLIELSDLLDGTVARAMNQVSDFGKLLDPFADVLSRLTYFCCFTAVGIMPAWVFIIIMYREFSVNFVRMMLVREGHALAARWSGKFKAVVYGVAGFAGVAIHGTGSGFVEAGFADLVRQIAIWAFPLAAVFAAFSFVDYIMAFLTLRKKLRADKE